MPRMKILNSVEREVFDFPPIFNSVERKRCFDFPTPLQDIATSLRTASNQLVFLLSCGYFKAAKRFYPVPTFHRRDLTYVADRIAVALEGIDLTDYPKQTMARHQAAILNFYGFRAFKPYGRVVLGAEITRLVQSHLKPKLIFSRALEALVREKVEVPGYFPLAALILTAINQHNRHLTSTVEALLTPDTRALLDTLLQQESDGEAAAGSNATYKLTLMKKLSQSTKPAKVKERVADLQLIEARYRLLKPVLDHLTLGQDGIQYYAYGVIKAQIFQLTRRAERERYLHLIAFIAYQYYRLHDNLVDVLLTSLQSFHNSALREHKDQFYVRREQRNESLKVLVGFLDRGVLETLALIGTVAKNSELTDAEKVQRICALLADNQVTQSLDPGRFSVSLYKALLFLQVQNAIKSGTLNLEHSYKYRPLDAYLIDRERWQRDKPLLIERADLQAFLDPHQVLADLDAALYQQYLTTNAHILDGNNPHIKFKKVGFTVSTPTLEESDAEALQHYFPERDFVPLMEVLATVNRDTGWMGEFQHWQQRHHHGRPEDRVVYAGVIGIGCAIGIRKMARISHPISESELENAVNWYFSVDNINAASDRVLQLTDRLELPKLLRHTPDRSHTSSDGQKFEVRVDSLNANHSFKYFGKEQGVSVYTFRDERDLLWHSLVFSAADRESAYVIDGLMHNDVVKSDIHSTDAFGYSEAIFGTSHLVGVSYAPRFKNLKRQRLYIFRSRQRLNRSEWKIKPTGYCDEESIIQFWDDILRFIATIKLKETTASDIFRRLNSYSKQHGLYHALKAFGQILKSIFILRVIDEPVLRMSIEKVLSGIEHVRAFTRAVSVGNPHEFLQAEKEDQEMAEACKRLIKNCIICWNYLYLSQKLAEIDDPAKREELLQAMAHGSAAAWGHLNLLGEYDFSEDRLQDSVGIKPPKLTD